MTLEDVRRQQSERYPRAKMNPGHCTCSNRLSWLRSDLVFVTKHSIGTGIVLARTDPD